MGQAHNGATPIDGHAVEVNEDGEVIATLPGKPTSWGGHGGKPMTEVPESALAAFVAWCEKDGELAEKYAAEVSFARGEIARRTIAEDAEQGELVEVES
jgi:hypothetical protein